MLQADRNAGLGRGYVFGLAPHPVRSLIAGEFSGGGRRALVLLDLEVSRVHVLDRAFVRIVQV